MVSSSLFDGIVLADFLAEPWDEFRQRPANKIREYRK
jgi:hypothetical protein